MYHAGYGWSSVAFTRENPSSFLSQSASPQRAAPEPLSQLPAQVQTGPWYHTTPVLGQTINFILPRAPAWPALPCSFLYIKPCSSHQPVLPLLLLRKWAWTRWNCEGNGGEPVTSVSQPVVFIMLKVSQRLAITVLLEKRTAPQSLLPAHGWTATGTELPHELCKDKWQMEDLPFLHGLSSRRWGKQVLSIGQTKLLTIRALSKMAF